MVDQRNFTQKPASMSFFLASLVLWVLKVLVKNEREREREAIR